MASGCDCANLPCSCKIQAGGGILLTGSGTPRDSYFLEVDPDDVADATNLWNVALPADIGLMSSNATVVGVAQKNSENAVAIFLPTATLVLVAQYVHQPFVTTGCIAYFAIAGTGLVPNQNFLGLYDSHADRIALTADLTDQWSKPGTGPTKFLWTAPARLSAGMYWVAWICNSTGVAPAFNCVGTFSYTSPNPYAFLTPATYPTAFNAAGVTALPTAFNPSANTMSPYNYWAGLLG
jgi:hypothetical protein